MRERKESQLELPNQNPRPNNAELLVPRREQPRLHSPKLFAKPKFTIPSFKGDNGPDNTSIRKEKLISCSHTMTAPKINKFLSSPCNSKDIFELGGCKQGKRSRTSKFKQLLIGSTSNKPRGSDSYQHIIREKLNNDYTDFNKVEVQLKTTTRLCRYKNLEDTLKKAMKIEAQIQRRFRFREHYQGISSSYQENPSNPSSSSTPSSLKPRNEKHDKEKERPSKNDTLSSPKDQMIICEEIWKAKKENVEKVAKAKEVTSYKSQKNNDLWEDFREVLGDPPDGLPPESPNRYAISMKSHDLRESKGKTLEVVIQTKHNSFKCVTDRDSRTNPFKEWGNDTCIRLYNTCFFGLMFQLKPIRRTKSLRFKAYLFEREDDSCITRLTSKEEVITLSNDPLIQALEKKIRTTSDLRRLFEWDPDLIWSTYLLEIQSSVSYLGRTSLSNRRINFPRMEEEFEEEAEVEQITPGARNDVHRNKNDNFSTIKVTIPPFQGRTDPEAYLDWWDQLESSRRRNSECPISTWEEMKAIMRKRFVPTHYHLDLYHKLQNLKQENHSIEDYFKEMEIAMIRANVDEDREATMARFLSGLIPEIVNLVELQHYLEIEEMVHMALKLERQIKREVFNRSSLNSTTKWKQEPNTFVKPTPVQVNDHFEVTKTIQVGESNKGKERKTNIFERSRDIKCFKCFGKGHVASQCPNRNTMIVLDNGDVVSDSEELSMMRNLKQSIKKNQERIYIMEKWYKDEDQPNERLHPQRISLEEDHSKKVPVGTLEHGTHWDNLVEYLGAICSSQSAHKHHDSSWSTMGSSIQVEELKARLHHKPPREPCASLVTSQAMCYACDPILAP
ncbi:hypothetical protein F3Y22_tig00110007pilonHSYRG00200 [Hibiscus syriacus]|uniref:CCHC-type domain-containing protein n=1 Tax=Hibiscus syriacus TaxID=106335 RepID=A0A6A3BUU6_HIBSY|nr:hypothetical protein F3Y22_tig00110007pilonHSYRG00200 [Hibiscus syriacus]